MLKIRTCVIMLILLVGGKFYYNVNYTIEKYRSDEALYGYLTLKYHPLSYFLIYNLLQNGLEDFQVFIPKNKKELANFISEKTDLKSYDLEKIREIYQVEYRHSLLSYMPFYKTTIYIFVDYDEKVIGKSFIREYAGVFSKD